MICQPRPRIYWFETAHKWAISAAPLADARKAEMFASALRQQCRGIFNEMVHAWIVDDEHLQAAQQVVKRYYGHYELIAREQPQATPKPPPRPDKPARPRSPAYIVFCALVGWDEPTGLSYDRARVLYRHAAARLHPDAGGSADEMAALNVAWVAVRDLLI